MALALRSWCDEGIIALSNCLKNFGIKADVATLEALNTAFRQNFDNISPWHNNEQPVYIGATRGGALPLIWGRGPDQGRPVGQPRAGEGAASAQPRDVHLSLQGSKSFTW
jgi:hypothetical protein